MIQGHGGNVFAAAAELGCRPEDIVDMSSNINPLGTVPGLMEHLRQRLDRIMVLPEVDAGAAVLGIAGILGVAPDRVLMGTGTTQFIYTVCPALDAKRVLIVGPTYSDYASSCRMHNIAMDYFLTDAAEGFTVHCDRLVEVAGRYDTVFICNPNNPTGHLIPHEQLLQLCRQLPQTNFVIDESYLPFVPAEMDQGMTSCELENVVVLWSISKIFGIPGLRAGFLVANRPVVDRFSRYMQPWCANSLAQEAICYLADHEQILRSFLAETKAYLHREMQLFHERLAQQPLVLYPTVTPYQLIGLSGEHTSEAICARLVADRLLIRDCGNFHGLSNGFVRISLKRSEINRMAAERLAAAVGA